MRTHRLVLSFLVALVLWSVVSRNRRRSPNASGYELGHLRSKIEDQRPIGHRRAAPGPRAGRRQGCAALSTVPR